jgi:hypothetical protein
VEDNDTETKKGTAQKSHQKGKIVKKIKEGNTQEKEDEKEQINESEEQEVQEEEEEEGNSTDQELEELINQQQQELLQEEESESEEEVPRGEPTNRFAIVNVDWHELKVLLYLPFSYNFLNFSFLF